MMRDIDKTKEQLIGELAQTRKRITELQTSEAQQEQMKEALQESERRYRLLAENAKDAIWTVDMNMRPTYMSPSITYLLGYTVEEAMAKPMEAVYTPASFEIAMKVLAEELAIENIEQKDLSRSRTLELELNRKDGSIVPIEGKFTFLRDSDGRPVEILVIARDITDRKQAERVLMNSEEKYRQLIENLQEGIWVIDKDAYTSFVNSRMADMLGYTVDEMLGKHFFSFMDQYSVEIATRSLERRKHGIKEQHDFEFLRKDGMQVYTIVETSPITDEEGNYAGAIAGVQDITERKQMEETLRKSEEKYREIINTSIDGVISVDSHMKILVWNQGAERIFGYTGKDMLGQTMIKIVPERYREVMSKGFAQFVRTGSGPAVGEVLELDGLTKEGKEVSIELSLASRKVGETYIATAVIRDITQRKRVEEALRETEERHRDLLDNANDLIQSVTPDGHFLYVNKMWQKTLGYSDEEITDLRLWDIIHPDFIPHCREVFQKVMSGKQQNNVEAVFITKDGKSVTVEGNVNCRFKGEEPVATRGIFRDITKRKKVEEALRESEEQSH